MQNSVGHIALEIAQKHHRNVVVPCLTPGENGLPACLNQLKNTPPAVDESTQAMGINLPPELNAEIVTFTFFKPCKAVHAKLAQHDESAADEKASRSHLSCGNSNS